VSRWPDSTIASGCFGVFRNDYVYGRIFARIPSFFNTRLIDSLSQGRRLMYNEVGGFIFIRDKKDENDSWLAIVARA